MKIKRWFTLLYCCVMVFTSVVQAAPKEAAAGGFFRIVNLSEKPYTFDIEFKIHSTPWIVRKKAPSKGVVSPGEASDWIHVPDFIRRAPFTVIIRAPRGNTNDSAVARVEFASGAADNAILRSLLLEKTPVVVECSKINFMTADEIKTDAEIGTALLNDVKSMTFKGKAPVRFPTGYPGGHSTMYEAGRVLGFTAIHADPGGGREMMERYGYRYIYSYTHLLEMAGMGLGYRRDNNAKHAETAAEAWRKAGLLDQVYYVIVRDEAYLDVGQQIKTPLCAKAYGDPAAWSQILQAGGVRPEDLMRPENPAPAGLDSMSSNYWAYVVGFTPEDKKAHPQGVYSTMKAAQGIWPTRFGNASDAFHEAFGSNVLTVANIHINAYIKDNLSGIDPWLNYSRASTLDVPQSCDYWIGWPQQEEFLIDLLRCAGRPHDKPVNAMLQSQSSYQPQTARSLKLRAMSALGAGARSLSFYEWGPRYMATENWYDTDPKRLQMIGEINHAVGWVEDIVMSGHPALSRLAVLYSRPSELWDRLAPARDIEKPGAYLAERRMLYHLLRGMQQQVDMIQDEVLPAEQGLNVDQYGCIIMSQRCITAKGADMLLDWVKRGGTLVGIVSCGQFDELEQPWDKMIDAFGLKSLEAMTLGTNDKPRLAESDISLAFMYAKIDVSDASVVMKFADGSPAVTEKTLGKGRLIYSAWMPGASYRKGASFTNGVLLGMQEQVRPIVADWIRSAGTPVCIADHPLVSARLIQSPGDSAIFLINSSGSDHLEKVGITLHGLSVKRVESLEQGPLKFTIKGDDVVIDLPLGLTDVLRISSK